MERIVDTSNPTTRRLLGPLLQLRVAADAVPPMLHTVLANGKLVSFGFVAIYFLFLSVWLPFWLLSFAIGEWGIYALAVATIFLAGRSFIRMIAFAGANARVVNEIETEFAKYSVRMILAAVNSFIDVGGLLAAAAESPRDVAALWRHAQSYRHRVLGVYLDVLVCLYRETPTPSHPTDPDLTRYGNNRLVGDIGDLSGLTPQARTDGRALLDRLINTIRLINDLEDTARPVLEGKAPLSSLGEESRALAQRLLEALVELRDFTTSLKPPQTDTPSDDEDSEDDPADSIRRKMDEQTAGSAIDAVKSALSSILPMLDPPPHTSIFGFDVQRGCMMTRYRRCNQFWVRRPRGGMVDVLHFPAQTNGPRNPRAVLYCNPNAGLIEVATGMSLVGGNIVKDPNAHESWVDFYTAQGMDIYVFNYAGYGRSYGTTFCSSGKKADQDYHPGLFARLSRIFRSSFFSFTPTPDTLREDGIAVALHLLNEFSIQQLVIHGESIGGVAATGTSRYLSQQPTIRNKLSLLVCDRTFCNLEAIAQRLVGGWSGYAIRALAPLWNTDVAGDFLAASCPKVVANDAADMIISDAASLKAGIALWKELHRKTTKGIGWITEEPLQYRMADWENVCVNDSRYVANIVRTQAAPVWPSDKYVSMEEAFHFAACCKRIGKFAKICNAEQGGMVQPLVVQAWMVLSCCDGLTGGTLGIAVKRGFDATVAWLCCCLVFGGQRLVGRADKRSATGIADEDFDGRPTNYEQQEGPTQIFPKPIPEVMERLGVLMEQGDQDMSNLKHELTFVRGILLYIRERLASTVEASRKSRSLTMEGESNVGSFMNLHCGHNNAFSELEKERYKELLVQALGN